MNKNVILMNMQLIRFIPADILFIKQKYHDIISSDLEQNLLEIPYERVCIGALNYSLLYLKSYRNVFYYRTSESMLLRHMSRWFLKPVTSIEILGKIGRGFRVYHNYCVIHPYQAGNNLSVNHGVTIGKGKPNPRNLKIDSPILGDNVRIFSNAVVFGGIEIGNNVNIGAGAVVNRDVPDNCTVVGNPMRIIQK